MIIGLALLLAAAAISGVLALDSGEGANACYRVDQEMRQVHGPCKPEEARGMRR